MIPGEHVIRITNFFRWSRWSPAKKNERISNERFFKTWASRTIEGVERLAVPHKTEHRIWKCTSEKKVFFDYLVVNWTQQTTRVGELNSFTSLLQLQCSVYCVRKLTVVCVCFLSLRSRVRYKIIQYLSANGGYFFRGFVFVCIDFFCCIEHYVYTAALMRLQYAVAVVGNHRLTSIAFSC